MNQSNAGFHHLGIAPDMLKVIDQLKFVTPTPIQALGCVDRMPIPQPRRRFAEHHLTRNSLKADPQQRCHAEQHEIARMLGGRSITDNTLAHASEMLDLD